MVCSENCRMNEFNRSKINLSWRILAVDSLRSMTPTRLIAHPLPPSVTCSPRLDSLKCTEQIQGGYHPPQLLHAMFSKGNGKETVTASQYQFRKKLILTRWGIKKKTIYRHASNPRTHDSCSGLACKRNFSSCHCFLLIYNPLRKQQLPVIRDNSVIREYCPGWNIFMEWSTTL
jgi:hypothetical protein